MNERVASCLLIAKVLVADGMMADHERAFLGRSMTGLGLSETEMQMVRALERFDEAEKVVAAMPLAQRKALVDQLLEAALADGKLSPHETRTVAAITKALGIEG
ncbi:MAG: TerB family tellurite resistance protein [Sandaracinus sp.]